MSETTTAPPLLDPDFLRRLEQLTLLSKRIFLGQLKGERRSSRRGTSVEFADYRNYTAGDDLRYVDWNTYARLEKLFIKLFVEEEDLHVYLLLDTSESMLYGDPSKMEYARKVAAALGYIALSNFERVGVTVFGERVEAELRPVRGRQQVFRFFEFLQDAPMGGKTSMGPVMQQFAMRTRQQGIVIVLSDFLDPQWEDGLKALVYRKFQVVCLQILDPDEVTPPHLGDLKLIDSETGEEREISVSQGLRREYQQAVESFCGNIQASCRRYGADYLRAVTDTPFEDLILRYLRALQLVK